MRIKKALSSGLILGIIADFFIIWLMVIIFLVSSFFGFNFEFTETEFVGVMVFVTAVGFLIFFIIGSVIGFKEN